MIDGSTKAVKRLLILVVLAATRAAFAACTNPAGAERKMLYNTDYHTYQFCNGTSWVAVGGTISPSTYASGGSSITIGDKNVETGTDSGANYLNASMATLTHAATIQSLSLYVDTAAGNIQLAIYDDSGPGGMPGAKKAETASTAATTGWNTISVTTPVLLPAGNYWLALNASSNSLVVRTGSGPVNEYWYAFTFGTMPATFSSSATPTASSQFSFYATLSAPGCTNPTGSERAIMYNTDYHTYQFCNGDSWVKMGAGTGGGGGGCSSPTASERTIIYNTDYHTYQFCNGTSWVKYTGGTATKTPSSSAGYFVMSKSTWNGNLGDVTGADAKCLTELTTNTGWKGYADANGRGLLTAAKVHAWICGVTCNDLNASTTYYFANANDVSKGGAALTTNSSSIGPNDWADWSSATYFGGIYTYWTDRGYGTTGGSTWGTGSPWATTAYCASGTPWSTASSGVNGGPAESDLTGDSRWFPNSVVVPCNTTQHLICFVNP